MHGLYSYVLTKKVKSWSKNFLFFLTQATGKWCRHCDHMKQYFEEACQSIQSYVKCAQISTDEEPTLGMIRNFSKIREIVKRSFCFRWSVQYFGIKTIPKFIIYREGQSVSFYQNERRRAHIVNDSRHLINFVTKKSFQNGCHEITQNFKISKNFTTFENFQNFPEISKNFLNFSSILVFGSEIFFRKTTKNSCFLFCFGLCFQMWKFRY